VAHGSSTEETGRDGLVRILGLPAMVANAVNVIVASGIFVLPAAVAAIVGRSWLVAYLICSAITALVLLSLAEAGSRVSETGGTYRYVQVAFGPFAGALLGVVLLFSSVASNAAVAVVFAETVGEAAPALSGGLARAVVLGVMFVALAAINVRGVRVGARFVEVVTAAKLAPLLLLIVAGVVAMHSAGSVAGGPGAGAALPAAVSASDIGRAALVLFFAFTGIEVALTPSGEFANPARTVPRAVLIALVIVTVVYIGVHLVAQDILGADLARDQTAPLAATAGRLFGPRGRALMLAAAALSTFSYVGGDILASPRMLFAFARDEYLPAPMGAVHGRYRTPHLAIIIYTALAAVLALSGTFRVLAALAAIAALLIYLACCLAVIQLRRRRVGSAGDPFLVPAGPVVPVLACLIMLWLLSHASRGEWATIGVVLAIGVGLYLARAGRMRRRAGRAVELEAAAEEPSRNPAPLL